MRMAEKRFPLFHPLSRRLHIVLLCMIGFFCTTFMRINFALNMTCMVNSTALAIQNEREIQNVFETSTENVGKCGRNGNEGNEELTVVDYGGSLIWTSNQQNLIFSGTFWGSLITVLPSMFFIQKFSPRHILLLAVMVYIVVTVATPLLAMNFGYFPVFLARVVMGLGEGFIMPTNNAIIGNWFPSSEKSTALSIFTLGNQIATAGGNPVVAALCASKFGWSASFYAAGAIASAWCIIWYFTSSSHPEKVKVMKKQEKQYLLTNVLKRPEKSQKNRKIPYWRILTSSAFLAQLQCHFFVNIFMTLFQIYLPTYFKEVLKLGVIANGTFSSIPNIFNMVFKVVWGIGIDKLKEHTVLTDTSAVKISHGIGSFGSALSLILLAFFVDCSNPTTALIIFCFMYSAMGTFVSGFFTSLLCLAPQYTATMSSISMFVAMIGRLCTPFFASILRKEGTAEEWRNIFIGCALTHIFSGAIFVIFGSGDLQDFAKSENDDDDNLEMKMENKGKLDLDLDLDLSQALVRGDSLCI